MADAPVEALLARLEDLAKGWLLALLESVSLDDMPAILAADLVRDGPRLCEAIVRALADDADLRRLEAGGALELLASSAGELAGAQGSEATVGAIEALHGVLWGAVRDAISNPDADQIAELAERLTLAIELVRAAALRHEADRGSTRAAWPAPAPPPASSAGPSSAPSAGPPSPPSVVRPPAPSAGPPSAPSVVRPPAHPATHPLPEAPAVISRSVAPGVGSRPVAVGAVAEPAVGDERGAAAGGRLSALWVGAFEEELTRSARSGAQLTLLLIELEDADRALAVEAPGEASAMFGRFAQAVREGLRRQDILACESETRAWVIATDTGRPGAQALASRIAATVAAAPHWRGAPMSATIGIAVLGEDGRDPVSLIEVAEETRFAAAASGIAVITSVPAPDASA